jgi:tetratricopeptide (TPR) repeat protein/transcriptional regulator with XRE-family HTH domain
MARRERFAGRRKALGLTQEELAALLGVERTTVARWERGETEPLAGLRPRLAKALRVSPDQLTGLLHADGAISQTPPTATDSPRPAAADEDGTPAPRQLPAAVLDFTGRASELAALTGILDAAGGTPGTVVVSAISGTAGVGKTTLAVHWAHQVADRFGDGQLYVNLRGFDPSGVPVAPADAIRGFLDALGVPPDKIPHGQAAQAGLYRGLLADRRMLVVLDNARDEAQVRPLLPPSAGSLIIVTSRNALTGLAATDAARLLPLDVLAHGEAVQLLTARIGGGRCAAEPEAVAEIATRCACLPLGLAVAAARATARPRLPLSALTAELRDAAGRLDVLDTGDPVATVRAVFSWSYDQLNPDPARMFRLLGLHPGPDITVPAAASIAATDQATARRLLRELTRAHLITEHVPGRYASHDLLRAYAADRARDTDGEADRAAATARLLDHYLHTATAAAEMIDPWRARLPLAPLSPGAVPEPLGDYQQLMTWFGAEHDVLFAAVAQAAGSGFDQHAWQLPWAMADYLERRGYWHERIAIMSTGAAAAARLGDAAGEAVSRRILGHAYFRVGEYGQADPHLRHAIGLYRRRGDHRGQAKVHTLLAGMASAQSRYPDAIVHGGEALELFRAVGDKAGEAEMLNNMGSYYGLVGDYQQSRAYCQRSLSLSAELGHRFSEGYVLDSLGSAEHHLGNFSEAAACYERALGIVRELADRWAEAEILAHLGDTRHAAGELPQALEAWQQALAILDELGHPDAAGIRAKLASIGE